MDYDTNDYDRIPDLEAMVEFQENPDQRTPCVLLLDTSYSMSGAPLAELQDGLEVLQRALREDTLARRRVEVAVVTFGGSVQVLQDFVTVDRFEPPRLYATGGTPMGEAIERGLDLVAQRKALYAQAGVMKTLPWVFLITDGAPTDAWETAAQRVQQADAARDCAFFAVGVEQAEMATLRRIAPSRRPPLKLSGLKFAELFEWLSRSLSTASRSAPGTQVALPPPEDWADGWGRV